MRGIVVKFDEARGFGFIRAGKRGKSQDVFVHINDVAAREPLRVGQRVDFALVEGAKGACAKRVVPGNSPPSLLVQFSGLLLAAVLILLFFLERQGLHLVMAYLLSLQIATFLFYGFDKLASTRGWLRVPERILHAAALLGGSPTALLAQKLFRHKTRKETFRRVQMLVLGLQATALLIVVLWLGGGISR